MAYLPDKRRSPLVPPADGQDRLSALPKEILLTVYDYMLPFHANNREVEEYWPKDISREGRFPSHLPCPAHPLLVLASTSRFYRAGLNEYALDVFRQWPHLNRHYRVRKQRWTHLELLTRKSNIGELIWLCGRFCVHCGRKTSSSWGRSRAVSSFASCCWVYGDVLDLVEAKYRYFLNDRHFFEHMPGRPSHWPLIDVMGSRYMMHNSHRFAEQDVKRLAEAVWAGTNGIEAERQRRQNLQHKPYSAMKRKDILDVLPIMIQRRGDSEADEWVATACRDPAVEAVAVSLEECIHPDLGFGLFD